MPRAIWKGVISFGMVSIPIRLFPATESKDIGFRQLRRDTNTRVRMLRWDPVEEQGSALRGDREGLRVRQGPLRHRRR
ncbi:MAG: hypothetical protein OXS47_13450 [Chloroflexota bacterium]|nr:hypothetical protein [Chloroflexota bacterium]